MSPQASVPTDPYAQFGGAAVPTGPPTPPADPYAQFGGAAVPTGSMSASQPTFLQRTLTELRDPNSKIIPKGAAFPASAARTIAGGIEDTANVTGNILSMLNHSTTVGLNDEDAAKMRQTPSYHAVRDAADWLRSGGRPTGVEEHIGALGAEALQWLGPEAIMKLVGPAAKAGEVVDAAAHFDASKQIAQTLTKNPKLAGYLAIGIKATKDALGQAAFQYAHTQDPTDAAIAAATGGITSIATQAAGPTIGAGMDRYRTRTIPIEGAGDVRITPQQLSEEGEITGLGAGDTKVARGQQQAFSQMEGHMARKGAASVLEDVNAARTTPEKIAAARDAGQNVVDALAARGQAPEQVAPFTFSIEPEPTAAYDVPKGSTVTGQPEDVRVVKEPGQGSRAVPSEGFEQPEGAPEATHATTYPPATVERPEGHSLGGGATLQTQDVNEATRWLASVEEHLKDARTNGLSSSDVAALEYQRKSLTDQISMYHSANPNARFQSVDIPNAIKGIQSPAQAATVLRTQAQPILDNLNDLSEGEFGRWHEAERKAQTALVSRDNTKEAQEALQQQIAEAQGHMNRIFLQHGDQVSPQDFADWHKLQRNAYVMDGLDTLTKKMADGITPETSKVANLQRYVRGNHDAFENWLKDPQFNGARERDLTAMIGKEGVNNYRQMFRLLGDAPTARATNGLFKNIITWQGFKPTIFGASPFALHYLAGVPAREAVLATGAVAGGHMLMRKLFQYAADNPKVGDMVRRAVSQDIAPKLYAPLISRTIMQELQKDSPTHDEDEQEAPAKP